MTVLGHPRPRRAGSTLSAHRSTRGCTGVVGWTGLDDSTNALALQWGQASGLAGLSGGGGLMGFAVTTAAASVGAGGGHLYNRFINGASNPRFPRQTFLAAPIVNPNPDRHCHYPDKPQNWNDRYFSTHIPKCGPALVYVKPAIYRQSTFGAPLAPIWRAAHDLALPGFQQAFPPLPRLADSSEVDI